MRRAALHEQTLGGNAVGTACQITPSLGNVKTTQNDIRKASWPHQCTPNGQNWKAAGTRTHGDPKSAKPTQYKDVVNGEHTGVVDLHGCKDKSHTRQEGAIGRPEGVPQLMSTPRFLMETHKTYKTSQ
jgi:hypothetical protein